MFQKAFYRVTISALTTYGLVVKPVTFILVSDQVDSRYV